MSDHKLAAILSSDVVGYSAHMEQDETATLDALNRRRKTIIESKLQAQGD